jgi:hypothetical protein
VCGGVGAGGVCAVVCVGLGLPPSVSLRFAGESVHDCYYFLHEFAYFVQDFASFLAGFAYFVQDFASFLIGFAYFVQDFAWFWLCSVVYRC